MPTPEHTAAETHTLVLMASWLDNALYNDLYRWNYRQEHLKLIELWFCVPLDTKQVVSETFLANLLA